MFNEHEVIAEINARGFCVFSYGAVADRFEPLRDIAARFGLGEAYVPELYASPQLSGHIGYNIAYSDIPRDLDGVQPGSAVPGQSFHVDALLEPLGAVKTSILYCVRPARSGGATQVFRACDAYEEIRATDPDAAAALADSLALRRFSTIGETRSESTGPAFGWVDGTLSTRFADGATEEWNDELGPDLERGVKLLREMSAAGGAYTHDVRLQAGECLIIRNDRVAHRGTPYVHGMLPRHLTRAMFRSAPSAS
ncbi:TauD/TfdA family dioxygenase [Streptomyces avidinii]|uniref:TauD/TfdA family dioxygenase n=1 Tax=Streptomyces avidinii TaxID=1895 RepID=UPI003794408E